MTPQKQLVMHRPDLDQYGDCERAVIASLLDKPIATVPNFNQIARGDATIYWEEIHKYLLPLGYAYLTLPYRHGGAFFGVPSDLEDKVLYHGMSGRSPRDPATFHAVVGCNGKVVFDPHPDDRGILQPTDEWTISYLVRVGSGSTINSPLIT